MKTSCARSSASAVLAVFDFSVELYEDFLREVFGLGRAGRHAKAQGVDAPGVARVKLLEREHVARGRGLRQLVVGSAFCLELGCRHLSEHSAEKIAGVQITTLHSDGQRESVRLLVELGKLPAGPSARGVWARLFGRRFYTRL